MRTPCVYGPSCPMHGQPDHLQPHPAADPAAQLATHAAHLADLLATRPDPTDYHLPTDTLQTVSAECALLAQQVADLCSPPPVDPTPAGHVWVSDVRGALSDLADLLPPAAAPVLDQLAAVLSDLASWSADQLADHDALAARVARLETAHPHA